jgi:hypothetical protein
MHRLAGCLVVALVTMITPTLVYDDVIIPLTSPNCSDTIYVTLMQIHLWISIHYCICQIFATVIDIRKVFKKIVSRAPNLKGRAEKSETGCYSIRTVHGVPVMHFLHGPKPSHRSIVELTYFIGEVVSSGSETNEIISGKDLLDIA